MLHAVSLTPGGLFELSRSLEAAGLPVDDLEEPGRAFFRFEDEGGAVGYGGLEGEGSDRLLRSLVVAPERRGQGLGRLVLAEIEEQARDSGAARLHLLTTTAAAFFAANGYQESPRASAPEAIRVSKEFSAICPSSATYMVKAL
ncbi:MAG TPA: arsenic resistance N-acetyltransferase ArsN2 [Allosphingosinicella sp.]|jgi:amino-acid N-acetyltransferase